MGSEMCIRDRTRAAPADPAGEGPSRAAASEPDAATACPEARGADARPGRPAGPAAPDPEPGAARRRATGRRSGQPGDRAADHGHLQPGLSELDPALRHPRRRPAAHPGRSDPVGGRADHARADPGQSAVQFGLSGGGRRRAARAAPDRAVRRARRLPRRGLSPDLQHRARVPEPIEPPRVLKVALFAAKLTAVARPGDKGRRSFETNGSLSCV